MHGHARAMCSRGEGAGLRVENPSAFDDFVIDRARVDGADPLPGRARGPSTRHEFTHIKGADPREYDSVGRWFRELSTGPN
jgi:hypothetical protein